MMIITIVGVGALGSHVVQFLRNLDDVTLRLVDFDRVEAKNVASQFYGHPSVGKNKAVALLQQTSFLFKRTAGASIPHRLTADNVDVVLGGSDLVVDCVDNGETRRLIQAWVRRHKVPCLHGGLAANGSFGVVLWDDQFTVDDEPNAGAATCDGGEHLPFIAFVASAIAMAVQAFVTFNVQRGFMISPVGAQRA